MNTLPSLPLHPTGAYVPQVSSSTSQWHHRKIALECPLVAASEASTEVHDDTITDDTTIYLNWDMSTLTGTHMHARNPHTRPPTPTTHPCVLGVVNVDSHGTGNHVLLKGEVNPLEVASGLTRRLPKGLGGSIGEAVQHGLVGGHLQCTLTHEVTAQEDFAVLGETGGRGSRADAPSSSPPLDRKSVV